MTIKSARACAHRHRLLALTLCAFTSTAFAQAVLTQSGSTLSWSNAPSATSINVIKVANGAGQYLTTISGTAETYTPPADGTYQLQFVTSVDWRDWDLSNSVSFTAPTTGGAGSALMVTASGSALSWNAVSGATGYNIMKLVNGSQQYLSTVSGTSYSPGSAGVYIVTAVSGSDWRNWTSSDPVSYTPGTTAPPQGSGDFTVSLGNGVLSWSAVSGASAYNILRGSQYVTTVNSTTYTPGSDGSYKVVAVTGSDWRTWPESNPIDFAASGGTTTPPTTGAFTASASGTSMSWTAVSGAASYNIIRIENGVDSYVTSVSSLAYNATVAGTYYVQAVVGSDWRNWKRSNSVALSGGTTTPPVTQPPASSPYASISVNLKVSSWLDSVRLSWAPVNYNGLTPSSYQIERDSVVIANTAGTTYGTSSTLHYRVGGLSAGTEYTWKVTPVWSDGKGADATVTARTQSSQLGDNCKIARSSAGAFYCYDPVRREMRSADWSYPVGGSNTIEHFGAIGQRLYVIADNGNAAGSGHGIEISTFALDGSYQYTLPLGGELNNLYGAGTDGEVLGVVDDGTNIHVSIRMFTRNNPGYTRSTQIIKVNPLAGTTLATAVTETGSSFYPTGISNGLLLGYVEGSSSNQRPRAYRISDMKDTQSTNSNLFDYSNYYNEAKNVVTLALRSDEFADVEQTLLGKMRSHQPESTLIYDSTRHTLACTIAGTVAVTAIEETNNKVLAYDFRQCQSASGYANGTISYRITSTTSGTQPAEQQNWAFGGALFSYRSADNVVRIDLNGNELSTRVDNSYGYFSCPGVYPTYSRTAAFSTFSYIDGNDYRLWKDLDYTRSAINTGVSYYNCAPQESSGFNVGGKGVLAYRGNPLRVDFSISGTDNSAGDFPASSIYMYARSDNYNYVSRYYSTNARYLRFYNRYYNSYSTYYRNW